MQAFLSLVLDIVWWHGVFACYPGFISVGGKPYPEILGGEGGNVSIILRHYLEKLEFENYFKIDRSPKGTGRVCVRPPQPVPIEKHRLTTSKCVDCGLLDPGCAHPSVFFGLACSLFR